MINRYFFPFLHCLLAMAFLSQAIPTQQITGASVSVATVANRPFPQHVTYASGTIRPTNFTQAQQDQHVRDFYDYWKTNYLVAAGTNGAGQQMYRVAFGVGSDITVSEGQGYGMVIVALMAGHDADAQALFDGLWYFAREYPSGIDNRLMSWKVQNGTIVDGNDSAFDGDIDIAYGLLLADAQWGSDGKAALPSEVDYEAGASEVIDGILDSTIGESSRLPMLGDWVNDNGSPHNQYTPRSSDFMPANFRAFGRANNNAVWETVISNSQAVIDSIQSNYSPVTGLLPDFIINCSTVNNCAPASASFLEGAHDGHYYYNAGRDPWRIGLDALLNDDAGSRAEVQKMVSWVANASGGDASQIKAGYQLDGATIGNYFTTFFVAPFGVGAMLDASQQQFLNDIYGRVYNAQENYYEDSVNLLALLAMTGNYWDPTANSTPPPSHTPGPSPTATPTITRTPDPNAASRFVAYFVEWGIYDRDYVPADVPVDSLTHINYAFIEPEDVDGDGLFECTVYDTWAAEQKPMQRLVPGTDTGAGEHLGLFNQFKVLRRNHPDLQLLMSVGGWTLSQNFPTIAANAAHRQHFVQSCVQFMQDKGFDGIDLDWEYPTAADTDNFTALLSDFRQELDALSTSTGDDYPLTIAGPAGAEHIADINIAAIAPYLDWVNVMTYDFYGGWEQYAGHNGPLCDTPDDPHGSAWNSHAAIQTWLAGMPANKLHFGLPYYSRPFHHLQNSGPNPTYPGRFAPVTPNDEPAGTWDDEDGLIDYWDMLENFTGPFQEATTPIAGLNGYTRYWDDEQKVPFLLHPDAVGTSDNKIWMGYDDPQSMAGKIGYAQNLNLGGVFIWELSEEGHPGTTEHPLTEAIATALAQSPAPFSCDAQTPIPTSTPLLSTPLPTSTHTATPLSTSTHTETPLPTATHTETPLPTATYTETPLPTATYTETPLPTATNMGTPLPTATYTETPLPTATNMGTPLPTATHTETALPTATNMGTPLPTATNMGTPLPTATNMGTPLPTATHTETPLPTATHTETALPTATYTETALPTATQTATTLPTATHTATNTPPPNAGSCTIDYVVTSQWNTGFNVSVIINNNTGADIEGWTLTWSFAGNQQITSLWNGLYTQEGTKVTVTNESYNSSIPNGGTQSFGFQGTYSGPNETPPDFVLNGIPCNGPAPTATPEPPTGPSCMVDYTPSSDWGIGFVANLIISNNSATTWHDWTVTWSFSGNQQISNLWNGNITQTSNQVSVENASWNGNILHGSTVNLGFQASYSGDNALPSDFAVNGQPCNGITPTPTNTPAPNAPTIEQLLPAQGANTLPNEINLFGSNLQADSTVSMNPGPQRSPRLSQMPLASTFINATHLRVVIPAGLLPQSYHLTVENPDGSSSTLTGGYTVTEAQQDDLFSNQSQLWNMPSTLRAGDEAQLGLLVYREGGSETLQKVSVSFYLTNENDVQDALGTGEIPLLAPNSSQSTIPLTWTVPAAGDYTFYAIIDEANHISETNQSNNVIVRPITILPAASDVTPPTIDDFTINNGATETSSQDIELSISATDPAPPPQSMSRGTRDWGGMKGGTGVESVYIIEYEYNQALSLWIPAQLSDWLPYAGTPSTYNWSLLPTAGLKYLQLWAADGAGNISLMPQSALINYLPANATLATGLSHFYAYDLVAGESLTASLTPSSGDPDLYLWSPNGAQSWFSINEGSDVDEVTVSAPATGRYMLQVYAYQSATYSLSVTLGAAQTSSQRTPQGKTPLSEPGLAPEALPEALTHALPSAPLSNEVSGLQYTIHLPVIVR